jgi:hypothetical protein
MDNTKLLELIRRVGPLIKSQTKLLNYREYHYSFNEIYSIYEDKLIDIVIKYPDKPIDELVYISITSIRNLTVHVSKMLVRGSYLELEENITVGNLSEDITQLFLSFKEKLADKVSKELVPILDLILTPPQSLVKGLVSGDKINNKDYLKYMGIPVTQDNLKVFQKHRNTVNKLIRDTVYSIDV